MAKNKINNENHYSILVLNKEFKRLSKKRTEIINSELFLEDAYLLESRMNSIKKTIEKILKDE